MGQILIRNIDDAVLAGLKQRAARHKTSAEEEARRALAASVRPDREAIVAMAREISALNGPQTGPGSLDLLRADRARDDDA